MANQKAPAKRYWVAALMAVALAETAHAPLRNRASGSTNGPDSKAKVAAADKSPADKSKKTPPPLDIPPTPDSTASAEPEKKALSPDLKKPDPFTPFPAVSGLIFSLDTTTPTTVSLLHTGDDDGSGVPVLGVSYGSPPDGNDSQVASPPGVDAGGPVDSVDGPVTYAPPGPTSPITANPVTGAVGQTTAVPEPGVLSILMGGIILLGRRPRRLNAA